MRIPIQRAGRLVPLLLAALACSDSTGTTAARGTVTVLLTDAPATAIEHAVVTLRRLELLTADGPTALLDSAVTVDLPTLRDTLLRLAGPTDVPGGDHAQLRLVIDGGYVEVQQGAAPSAVFASAPDYPGLPPGTVVTGSLVLPDSVTGVVITLDPALHVSGDARALALDFDVRRSYDQVAGQAGAWALRPVVHAADTVTLGTIRVGLVAAPGLALPRSGGHQLTLADLRAVIIPSLGTEADSLPLADPDGDGAFAAVFRYQQTGEYHVAIRGPEGVALTLDPTAPVVQLAPGGQATLSATLTGATLTEPFPATRSRRPD